MLGEASISEFSISELPSGEAIVVDFDGSYSAPIFVVRNYCYWRY